MTNDNSQYIQWYPGHMTRTRRQMEANLKLVDAVVEIIDARIPKSSRNPEIDTIFASRPRIILLNKADYAQPGETSRWESHFAAQGFTAISCDCRSGKGLNKFIPTCRNLLSEKIAQWESKGMKGHYIRLMVVGIPNVGKSSFINRMSKSGKAKVADKPGVTRGNQWFNIGSSVELLDTPGVLWPKFDDQTVARNLAFTGAVKDTILDIELLGASLAEMLRERCPDTLVERYKLKQDVSTLSAEELLEAIARRRGMLISGGEIDIERVCTMLLDEFRAGMLGRITLETVDDI